MRLLGVNLIPVINGRVYTKTQKIHKTQNLSITLHNYKFKLNLHLDHINRFINMNTLNICFEKHDKPTTLNIADSIKDTRSK